MLSVAEGSGGDGSGRCHLFPANPSCPTVLYAQIVPLRQCQAGGLLAT
jgi:hypothetical protein